MEDFMMIIRSNKLNIHYVGALGTGLLRPHGRHGSPPALSRHLHCNAKHTDPTPLHLLQVFH